ncbi:hypothetical protein [Pectobacterium versatile]|nr:hypothetical protein [Pectobacterium versatile]MCA6926291.1 hypothetical protein [Pectobacterium versatile]MCH5083041.1 hypothetical protein [Pectobacterium versatile]
MINHIFLCVVLTIPGVAFESMASGVVLDMRIILDITVIPITLRAIVFI